MSLAPLVLGPALLLLGVLGVLALRRPILLRMALRNLLRRRSQALAIALGLMVGTAIISGSLATGDSMTFTVRQASIDAFGPLDETVGIEGSLYFPQDVVEHLEEDPAVRAATDGITPILLENVAVGNARARQWEPRAALVGLDPERDARLGPYPSAQGLRDAAQLEEDEVVLNQRLAGSLDARAGDVVTVRYAVRPDPLIPRLHVFNGSISAGLGAQLPVPGLPPTYATSPLDNATFTFPVDPGAAKVTAALFWGDVGNRSDLDLALVSPDGARLLNANGTVGSPDSPAILNATAMEGEWTVRVLGKAAAGVQFRLAVLVFYQVNDLEALQDFLADLQQQPEAREFLANLTGGLRLESRDFRVRFVTQEPGRGSFLNAPDVFLRLDVAQQLFQKEGRVNLVLVSNPGGAEEGLRGTAPAMAALDASLQRLRAQRGDDPAVATLEARPIKQEWVEKAEQAGQLFTQVLSLMGSFSVLAGIILIVNIFIMLVEERRTELGIARALGLRRRELMQVFLFEGAGYAVVASALGTLLGLGISYGLITAFNRSWADRIEIYLPFRPTLDTMLAAFAAGILMTMVVIGLASHRAAKLNIVRSIRRLEEPDTAVGAKALRIGLAMVAVGLAIGVAGMVLQRLTLMVAGPNLAILGAGVLAARVVRRSVASKLAGAGMIAFNLYTVFAFFTPNAADIIVVGPVRGFLIVVGAALLIVQSRWLLHGSAALVAKFRAFRPIARTAFAYPLHKKLRTGLTVVMFGLVLTVVVTFMVLFALFLPNTAEQGGGYDVRADTTIPVEDLAARLRAAQGEEPLLRSVRSVTSLEYAEVFGGRLLTVDGDPVRYQSLPVDFLYGIDEAFLDTQDFPLLELHPDYATPREAYAAMLRDPSLVAVSGIYATGEDRRPGAHHVGDTVTMQSRSGVLNFTIVAIQRQVYYGGVFLSKDVLRANFDALHGLHLIHLAEGADARAVARAVESSQADLGMDAASIEDEAGEFVAQQSRLYGLFQVYLSLGLVLGVASLGITQARSVLERRQEVGMLRAIGMPKRLVFRSFLLEGFFVFTLGAIVGVGTGLVVAWGLYEQTYAALGIPFVVPWAEIGMILAVAYVATLAATLVPAGRAARLAPAEAIRYIE